MGIQGEKFDTDKTPLQALQDMGGRIGTLARGESEDVFSDLGAVVYKPFEALLGAVQGRGLTTHNVDFHDKLLSLLL